MLDKNHKQNHSNSSSFIDLLFYFTKEFKVIFKIIAFFIICGFIIAFLKPTRFTSISKVVAVDSESKSSGFSTGINALKNIGINLGSMEGGLNSEIYPKLISSQEILYDVIKKKFYFSDLDTALSIEEYISHKPVLYYIKQYTIYLPFTLYKLFKKESKILSNKFETNNILYINKREWEAINWLKDKVLKVNRDIKTGVITISTSTFNPTLSAKINLSIIEGFKNKIRQFYDQKNSENLIFLKERLTEAQQELQHAEQLEIDFINKNTKPNTIKLQTELERIKRKINYKSEIYMEIQLQLTRAEIKLNRQEPIIRLIERPYPPLLKSGMSKVLILITFFILGMIISVSVLLIKINLKSISIEQKQKIKKEFKNNIHFLKFRK